MAREYNSGTKPRSVVERGIRHSFENGTFTRHDVVQFNIKRRALGLPTVSLDGCKEPSAAVLAVAASQRLARQAKAKAAATRAAKKPTKPVASMPKASSITPAAMAKARAKVKAAQAAGAAKAKR